MSRRVTLFTRGGSVAGGRRTTVVVSKSGPQGPAGGGGGTSDHGSLTGLTDDDHPQYQRAESVFTSTSPFTITDESFVLTTGAAVTLPDATSNDGRTILVGAAAVVVTVTTTGTDSINISSGVVTSYRVLVSSGVSFTSLGAGGWVVTNEQGIVANLPTWYDVQAGTSTLTDGNILTVAQSGGLSAPAWTTGTRTGYEFLSGTGWTDDVPVLIPVKNTTASTIAKGVPVYATGTVGATSVVEIAPADCDDAAKMPAIGLTNSELTANATGYVTVVGTVRGVNTNAYSVNQTLYVSTTAGQLTGTKPTGSSELIQGIGRVTRVNTNSGEILVLGAGRTNDVPNDIDAGKITSGTVATARLGTGTANSTTWLRGDQTWAAPTPWKVITDTTASVATATFSVTVTGYTDIEVMITGIGDSASASLGMRVQFNSDSGNNYLSNNAAASTAWNGVGSMPGSLTNTDRNGIWRAAISLGGVGRYTAGVYQNGFVTSTGTTGLAQGSASGSAYYINTSAAITTMSIFLSAGSFAAGTRLLVRGK